VHNGKLDKMTVFTTQSAATDEPIAYALVNGLMFNITWFAIVTTESMVVAPILAVLHLVVHFVVMGKGFIELKVVAQVTLIGVVLDQLLFYLNVFNVGGLSALPPLWLSCLWPVLATTFMHAFAGLQCRYFMASALGAVGGALSFIAGTGLTSVAFESDFFGPVIVGALWAVLFPLLLQIPRLNDYQWSRDHA
jgi:hypothetical protein